jgi:hypothetical protein
MSSILTRWTRAFACAASYAMTWRTFSFSSRRARAPPPLKWWWPVGSPSPPPCRCGRSPRWWGEAPTHRPRRRCCQGAAGSTSCRTKTPSRCSHSARVSPGAWGPSSSTCAPTACALPPRALRLRVEKWRTSRRVSTADTAASPTKYCCVSHGEWSAGREGAAGIPHRSGRVFAAELRIRRRGVGFWNWTLLPDLVK